MLKSKKWLHKWLNVSELLIIKNYINAMLKNEKN